MDESDIRLAGLEHLISVCRARHLPFRLDPPLGKVLPPKGELLGQSFDATLAATLSRLNGGRFYELYLYSLDDSPHGLGPFNEGIRMNAEERLQQVLRYARFEGSSYYLATVPSLADGNGVQPVIHLNMHEGVEILPIASSVDTAFELYADYLEALCARYGSVEALEAGAEEGLDLHFPESLPHLVARDERLLQMLARKQFDFLTAWDKRSTDWIARVQRAARRRT